MVHRLRYILLCAALAALHLTCGHTPKGEFDMQRQLVSLGIGVRKITLNPAMLTPFLDDSNPEEAALKDFLRSVSEVNIFSLPTKQALDDVALRAQGAGYTLEMDLLQKAHRMWVYAPLAGGRQATRLVVLLQDFDNAFYGIEVCGHVDSSTLANLNRISPAFLESYIRRFNVKF